MARLIARRAALALLVGGLAASVTAFAQQASEAAVKAALVFKFAAYVEWPAAAGAQPAPFIFGVAGADEIAHELEQVTNGRTIGNRPILVRRVQEGDSLAGLSVLFVGRREAQRLVPLVRAARPLSILVVSDAEQGIEQGSVINLIPNDGRIAFDVSLEAAERSRLTLSSRMLGVARRVVGRLS
jgi:hypothetical protein